MEDVARSVVGTHYLASGSVEGHARPVEAHAYTALSWATPLMPNGQREAYGIGGIAVRDTALGPALWVTMAIGLLLAPQTGSAAASADMSADQSPGGLPVSIGSWQVQAWNDRAGAFSHCTLRHLDNGFVTVFSRGASGYALALGTVRWKLQKNSTLPVLLMAGSVQTQAQALATSDKVVSISLQRNPALIPRIISELKLADALRIRIGDEMLQLSS